MKYIVQWEKKSFWFISPNFSTLKVPAIWLLDFILPSGLGGKVCDLYINLFKTQQKWKYKNPGTASGFYAILFYRI